MNARVADIAVSCFPKDCRVIEPIVLCIKGFNIHMTTEEALDLVGKLEGAVHKNNKLEELIEQKSKVK